MKKQLKTRKGFTIIEVVLVLAIAGLIFMMVFIALPALQRSQRDTQRNQDISRLSTAINNFKSNNRGKIPVCTQGAGDSDNGCSVTGRDEKDTLNNPAIGTWEYFYDNYLLVGSAGQTDVFADPDGSPYSLQVVNCEKVPGDASGVCENDQQRLYMTFDDQSAGDDVGRPSHSVLVVRHAACNGEQAVYSSGARNVALLYKREGGGIICIGT